VVPSVLSDRVTTVDDAGVASCGDYPSVGEPSEAGTLAAAWDGRYGVKLSTSERVGRQLMRRLYNMAHSEPPDFEIVLLEQITVYSSCPKSVQQVVKGGDNQLMMQAMQVDAVTSAHVAIDRIRALLFSFAYASCDLPEWCDFDQARSACEEIWKRIQIAESHNAPMSFYNDAYLASSQVWQTQIVVCGGTLSSALQNTASWIMFWTYNCPGCPMCWKNGRSGSMAGQAVEKSTRESQRMVQNAVWKTMQRYNKNSGGKGFGGKGNGEQGQWEGSGGKGALGKTQVWKAPFQKDWKGGKNGGKGKQYGGKNGGKGKQTDGKKGGWW